MRTDAQHALARALGVLNAGNIAAHRTGGFKYIIEPGVTQLCTYCIRWNPDETCAAFPDGIPEPVRESAVLHLISYPGDQGILFDAIPGCEILNQARDAALGITEGV